MTVTSSRFVVAGVLFSALLVLPGCGFDMADNISNWFGGKDDASEPVDVITPPPVEEDQPTPPKTSILDELKGKFSKEADNTPDTSPSPNLPEDSASSNVPDAPSSDDATPSDDASMDIPSATETTIWVHESNYALSPDGKQVTWMIQFQKGTGFSTATTTQGPASSVSVTTLLKSGGKTETLTGITGADGTVRWTRAREKGAAEMFLTGVQGDAQWDPRDATFWKNEHVLSHTADVPTS